MTAPVRSFSYGPDSSGQSLKKRKRGPEAESSLSCHLSWLSGSQTFYSMPTAATSISSNESSSSSEPGHAELRSSASPQHQDTSPPQSQLPVTRPMAHPRKRAHFTSSPIIPSTPALTYSSESTSIVNAATAACHLCYRRPKSVQELSSFMDCETCQQRTCNICTRICDGPRCKPTISARQTYFSGATPLTQDLEMPRGKVVCRTCCVEVGVEGRVWCQACYADDTETENFSLGKSKKELSQESIGRVASWLEYCGGELAEEPDTEMQDDDLN